MSFLIRLILTVFISSFGFKVLGLEIPKRLDAQDRREAARILGLNSSMKILSNPFPLGGYSGVELGVALEFIDTKDLARLGCQSTEPGCPNTSPSSTEELRYPRFSIGKGVYKNVDFFLSFVPPLQDNITDFGGMARWSFFQAKFLPINLAVLLHANRINFKDMVSTENAGAELIAGINVNNFSLYFGGGYVRSESTFIGGDTGNGTVDPADPKLNGSSNTVSETLFSPHSLVGVSLHLSNIFIAAQIDRYRDPVMSAKLGLRF